MDNLQRLRIAEDGLLAAVTFLRNNQILGKSMDDDIKDLERIRKRVDDIIERYTNPPPLPGGSSVIAVREDSPYRNK